MDTVAYILQFIEKNWLLNNKLVHSLSHISLGALSEPQLLDNFQLPHFAIQPIYGTIPLVDKKGPQN